MSDGLDAVILALCGLVAVLLVLNVALAVAIRAAYVYLDEQRRGRR